MDTTTTLGSQGNSEPSQYEEGTEVVVKRGKSAEVNNQSIN
jgi:hypothetical protein